MNQTSTLQSDMHPTNERLARAFFSSARYSPLLSAFAGLGLLTIFLLAQLGVLGNPAPQLLWIAIVTLAYAASHQFLLGLSQQHRGIEANVYSVVFSGAFGILLVLFWQGINLVSILTVTVAAMMVVRRGLPRRTLLLVLAVWAASVVGILYADILAPIERLASGAPAAIASLTFLIAASLLQLTITFVSQNSSFRSLQSLLVITFLVIVAIPTIITAVFSAMGAYTNTQAQTFKTLEAITTLKVNQLETLLHDSQNDTEVLLSLPRFRTSVMDVLTNNSADPATQENLKSIARFRMMDIIRTEEESYDEILVLDTSGSVVISTLPRREGQGFADELFFEQGAASFYAGFVPETSFGEENFIISTPLRDESQTVLGVLVLRSKGTALRAIMETTPGFIEAETYLVGADLLPMTKTRGPAERVETTAVRDAIDNRVSGMQGIYPNYAGQDVLGHYRWFEPMRVAMVAEVPLSFVLNSSLESLMGSAILALMVVAVAMAAVLISVRTIAEPIRALVGTTESFAAGKFATRATVSRADEIGALAKAYNQMAAQLQDMIGKLEQRVSTRTRDLESQTLRLRVAAEIARDAASSRDLRDLLSQTARLICDRFDFYHTGIFLLDVNKEFAVLIASPTEAGQKMIQNNHRLRVGETGIVGRVAATGEPRITLNTGSDAVYFNNPFLPNTRSEMALPLKVGNNVIGVLDVQSDQTEAFNQDDVAIMQILADQLATAIERTRLLEEVERNLRELESAYGRFTSENWNQPTAGNLANNKGYRFDHIRTEPIQELPDLAQKAIERGTIVSSNGSKPQDAAEHTVAVPIKLRGQTIGVIDLKLKDGYDRNTISVVELVTERLAAALESARLYEEARLRADREQSISRITSAISSSTEYEYILQTTVREIGSLLGDTEVAIQILDEPATDPQADGRDQANA